jgi:hypothetical protein
MKQTHSKAIKEELDKIADRVKEYPDYGELFHPIDSTQIRWWEKLCSLFLKQNKNEENN